MIAKANIDGQPYIVESDIRLQEGPSGKKERHFRLGRVYNINEITSQTGLINRLTRLIVMLSLLIIVYHKNLLEYLNPRLFLV